jgi:RimJ/RimL family protein N-acetyltransferase
MTGSSYMNFFAWFPRAAASAASSATFILRNLWRGRMLAPFATGSFGDVSIAPYSTSDLPDIASLYVTLTGGRRLDRRMRALLRLGGARFCLVARRRGDDRLIGIALYCFNAHDVALGWDDAIHEAYIGLQAPARGLGLGTRMRRHALLHFARSGLACVSSRVSVGNLPSLKGNLKLGFLPVETYFDSAMAEQRQYLICRLDRYR